MTRPDLSVVTVSSGRAQLLLRKLSAVADQRLDLRRLEVVLVDNACPDGVGAQAEGRRWPFALRVLRAARRLPPGPARCLALEAATAPLVWLSDDDCLPEPQAAERHLARQRLGPCVVVGGLRFVDPGRPAPSQRATPRARSGPLFVTGANTSLPREAMRRACQERLALPRPYGGEDLVLGLQLRDQGQRFVAAPEAVAEHHGPDPRWGGEPAKGYDAGYNAVAIARRWPEAAWGLGVHPLQIALKRLALASPEASFWRRLAPGRARYERAYLDGCLDARRALAKEEANP